MVIDVQGAMSHMYSTDRLRAFTNGEPRVRLELDEERTCAHCGESVAEYTSGWTHADTGNQWCYNITDEEARDEEVEGGEPEAAAPAASPPGNWSGIEIDEVEESVTVQISIGDPRGHLAMKVRRWHNPATYEDVLLLHVPHEDDATPHVELREMRPGTYIIGGKK